jgi:transglutaminase-like putative cysteine protease
VKFALSKLDNSQVLVISIFLASVPLYFWLPSWIAVWSISFCALQLSGGIRKTNTVVSSFIGLLALGILIYTFGVTYSMDFCVALLTLIAAIKPLEARTHRDMAVTLCMAYFVTLTSLWYSNALSVAIYAALAILVSTASLGYVNGAFSSLGNSAKLASRVLLQSLPLALILFVAFPRLNGSLWGLNISTSGKTGFTDSFSLGDVGALAKDNSVAFRVEFENKLPPPQERYWRGVVFSNFDGKNWTENMLAPFLNAKLTGTNPITYNIILEPHGQSWIFSLDFATTTPKGSAQMANGIVRSYRKITERKLFSVTSAQTPLKYIDNPMRRLTTKVPKSINPKTKAIVDSWNIKNLSPKERIQKGLDFLAAQKISYTLEPALTSGNHIDDFLFNTREGYCEHMASAYTYLMRLAGVPARVVGGYLGGELNPNGNYMIVRQADAHVWTEVWTEEEGWTRIDPTTVAAHSGEANRNNLRTQAALDRQGSGGWIRSSLLTLSLKFDSVSFAWNKWVLSYTREKQKALLESLGLRGKNFLISAAVFGSLGLALGFGLLASYLFHSAGRRRSRDPIARSYELFLKKCAKRGIKKDEAMGPHHFQMELEEAFPEVQESISSIMSLYIKLRYEEDCEDETLKDFATQVKEINL